jgi:Bacterial Ig domain
MYKKSKVMKYCLLVLILFISILPNTYSQILIPQNTIIKEDFSNMGVGLSLPANWKISAAGGGLTSNWSSLSNVSSVLLQASSGSPIAGGSYNWGTSSATDRAVGFMTAPSFASLNSIMAYYRNASGATVTTITAAFSVERYRVNTTPVSIALYSSVDGTTWTLRNAGDVSQGAFSQTSSSYTFANPFSVYRIVTISGLNIPDNGDFYFKWVFTTDALNSQGIGLDNVLLFTGTPTPLVIATMQDAITVDNAPLGSANQGDQLTYSSKIKNNGTGDAINVNYTAPAPTNTTLVSGSIVTSALARDDSYSTAFNTTLTGANVLTNDFGLPSITIISFGNSGNSGTTAAGNTGSSDNGGTVVVNSDGTFTYTPPTGFSGIDKFAYRATTGTTPDNDAIVTVTVGTPATAAADNYNVIGNVSISPNSAAGVLTNDGGNSLVLIAVNGNTANVGTAITTAQGGNLTVQANGSFTYNPPAGFEGADNFSYTADNGFGVSSSATVTLNVSGMIWFINNAAAAGGNGRLSAPFNSIAAFQAVNNGTGNNPAGNDYIFLYEGSSYQDPITLLGGQKLIGQDATATLETITGYTIPTGSVALPVTNSVNGATVNFALVPLTSNAITLNSSTGGNLLRGFSIGTRTGIAVTGSNFGTLTVSEVSINGPLGPALVLTNGTLSATFDNITSNSGTNAIALTNINGTLITGGGTIFGSSGTAISVTGGNINITCIANITQSNNAAMVSASGGHTGNITFQTGALNTSNGTGLQFDNADGTYNFNGTVSLNGGDAGIDITNGSSGNFTFTNTSITNPTGIAFFVTGGNGTITHTGAVTKTSAGRLIDIQSRTGGSITLNGNLSSSVSSTGINVSNCTGGTITFAGSTKTLNTPGSNPVNLTTNTGATINFTNGGLAITSTTATGFNATGGGTVSVQGTANTIISTTATALNVVSTTIGAGNLNFQSISSNGGSATGIILDNTGASGGLTVTGTGTASSGGTIANKTGADGSSVNGIGVYLNNTRNISLTRMQLNDFQNYAVRGVSVVGFIMDNCVIDGSNGTNAGFDEGSVIFGDLTGSASITNCNISGSVENNMSVVNTSGTLNRITVSGCTFGAMNAATGDDALLIESSLTSVINATVINNTFTNARGDHFQYNLNGSVNGDIVFTGNTISNTGVTAVSGGGGIRFTGGNNSGINAGMTFNVSNNTIRDSRGTALAVNKLGGSGNFTGTISNNTIGVAAVNNSGSAEGSDIFVLCDGPSGVYTVTISNNIVRQYSNYGIYMQTGGSGTAGGATMNATVTGNTVSNPSTFVFAKNGIHLNGGTTAGDTYQICLNLGGAGALANSITGTGTDGGTDFRIRQRQSTTVRLPGYAGTNNNDAAVITYIQGRNGGTPTGSASNTVPTGGGFVGGAVCPQ